MIKHALDVGCKGGWDKEEPELFHLYTEEVGASCFHDPGNKLYELLDKEQNQAENEFKWSRVYRQDLAEYLIKSHNNNGALIKYMAERTQPGVIEHIQCKYLDNPPSFDGEDRLLSNLVKEDRSNYGHSDDIEDIETPDLSISK